MGGDCGLALVSLHIMYRLFSPSTTHLYRVHNMAGRRGDIFGGRGRGVDQWRKRHGQIQLAGRTNRVTHLIHTDKSSPLNTPYLINTPSKDILLTHLLNIPTQPTLSTHPLNPPSQTTLSTHPLNPPSQPTLSTPTVNPPSRPTLSTQPSTQL